MTSIDIDLDQISAVLIAGPKWEYIVKGSFRIGTATSGGREADVRPTLPGGVWFRLVTVEGDRVAGPLSSIVAVSW